MVERRCAVLLAVVMAIVLAACGSASSGPTLVQQPLPPMIEFTQNGSSWNATPVEDELDTVSNNGLGYTGEAIDRLAELETAPDYAQIARELHALLARGIIPAAERGASP